MTREQPAVFAVGDGAGAWATHLRGVLDPSQLCDISARPRDLERCAGQIDVCLIHADDVDALVTVAGVWRRAPHVAIILSGADVDEPTRRAAYEAGVAFVTGATPSAEELRAILQMAHEQNRAGSPELLRAMCRTMCRLSSLAALANDRSFIDAAVNEIAELFRAEVVSVQLVDHSGALKMVAQLGLAERVARSAGAGSISRAVLESGEARIILRGAPASSLGEAIQRADLSASMCVPIASTAGGERVRGVISIARKNGRSIFTERDLEVATSIARLISEALGGIEARLVASETERQLGAAERLMMLGEIAAGIAHEVANPLAVARANVSSLIEYLTEFSPMLADLEAAHPQLTEMLDDLPAVVCETWEGLSRADETIRQVKSLARADLEGGRDGPVAVADLVSTAVRFLGARLPHVRTDLDPAAVVKGSAVELSQVLVNLLVNAGDACEERRAKGGDPSYKPSVAVTVTRNGDRVLLSVEDNGCGMSEDTLTRAFMPLFTTKPGTRGTGLGLSLVRRLIDRHAGVIRVKSTPGVGTCFSVMLPATSASRPERVELPELRAKLDGDSAGLLAASPPSRAIQ
ncbi:MAG: GAF domain-containing sensor histidine kinase [Deltaproteobacteria bacterium]|nr:GAF domain-containing sensor histidine kinase [Deltaproteobacteria bacterium]